ncbi:vWA domain-containing protein [Rhodobacter sp. NSM]|uniref:vWA domain-containing protein n=1 Tax=Rhodobacter sp. NSM TaxID=3457501 RepID=UPI003FD25C3C
MTRHSARASVALRALGEADPAMAALALWCEHRDREDGPPAATEGTTIHYSPAFEALPRHEQMGVAAHHILHVALRHTQRMAAMQARFGDRFDPEIYNIAADAIVNESLLLAGYALPRPALTLTGVLMAATGQSPSAREALAEWDADRLYIRLMKAGGKGRSAAEKARSHAEDRMTGRDLHPKAGGAAEDREEADWRQHLARALEAGRMAGRGIGLLGHRIADIPHPETTWEVELRGLVTRAVTEAPSESHRRPARDWIAMEAEALASGGPVPAFRPGRIRASHEPRIVIALDASSSIDDDRLALFMGEVAGIARRTAAEIHLLVFDETVQARLKLDPSRWQGQLPRQALARGGGTSFVAVLEEAAGLDPSIAVVLTDLDGPFGPAPRRFPVIWAVPDSPEPLAPPFGRVLSLAR